MMGGPHPPEVLWSTPATPDFVRKWIVYESSAVQFRLDTSDSDALTPANSPSRVRG